MASTSNHSQEAELSGGFNKVQVTILASEWGSSKGGLSTISRELAIQLAKFPEAEITVFLPRCSEEDKNQALLSNVKIVEATRHPGFDELDWLSFPPEHLQIDLIVGHGVKLGRQAQVVKNSKKCKWVQVVHTDSDELGMFKSYSNPISKGEEKHKVEVELCEMADLVVGIGPKLSEEFRSYLRSCCKDQNVVDFTPGVFDEFAGVQHNPEERKQYKILVFGRGDDEDFELKGFDIAARAVASLRDTRLVFVGAPDGKYENIAEKLKGCGVLARNLRVKGFVQSRKELKRLFHEVDLVLMPSRTEGFGLTGLEALSAGIPVLVSSNSGFGEALSKVPFGSSFVIDSEDPNVWAATIKRVWEKDRQERLEEAETLRTGYEKKYSWAKQSRNLLDKMISLAQVTSDTNLQERVAGSKRGAEYVQDAQSYMEENSKYLKTDQAVKARKGLTQACAEKEIPSVPHICYEIANCDADIAYFAGRHHKDTRQWLFEDFDKWFSDPGDSRAYVLLGDAGVGKSVIAGALAQRMMKAGHLGAAYFCRHNEVTRNNPRFLLGTLACQLCNGNGQYSNLMGGEDGVRRLLANSNLGIQELCTKLLEEPLFKCRSFQQRKLVVIDALDETQYSSRKDFIFLVKERFLRLPEWLLFFITSRPEDMLQSRLEKYNPCVRICTGQGEHRSFYECHEQDIQRYLENTVDFSGLPYSVKDVTEKCCGLFLYAFFVAKELNGLLLSGKVDQVSNSFPGDIEDFFETNLKRVYVKIGGDLYRKLLGSIMAAPSPLPVSFISFILNRESSRLNEQEVIDAVSLFVGIQKAVSFLHNLIPAWLTNKKKAQELYIDEKGAGEFLTEIVKEILSAFVGEPGPKLTSVERDLQICFVHFGVQLLCQRGGEDSLSLVFRCLTSYCFLEERICSGRFGIYHLLKDIERAVCCLASGTKKQNVLRKMSLALENDAHVLVESPHLLRSSIRNASDVVQEKVSIPDVSLPWFEWNVFDLSAFDILSGCYCFATTSDKETVVGAKGRSLFFFNSSMLQTVSGPFEISEDIIAGINHLEFSSDDKFIFFGRLDKWFSVDRGFLEDLPQFSGNVAVYQWGSVTPNGHCIVVKTNVLHFPRMCKRGCCFTELVALWALKEIENSRDEERTCSFGELSKRITRIDIMGRHTRNLMEYLGVDPRSYQGLVMFAPDDPSCYWCGRLKKLTESNQELYLATVRQRIIELYPCFFRYQIWNLQSGQPLLHDIFHQNAQLNPFVYFCHVSGAVDDWAKAIKCSGVIETVSVCNIAVVTAVYFVLKLKFELCRNGHVLETMEPDWERMKENEDYATYVRQLLLEMKDEESDKDSQCYVLLHQLERCINQEENPKLLQNKWVKLLSLFSECSTLERLRFPDFKRDSFLTCNPQNPDFLTHFPKGFLDLFRKNVSLCFSPEKNWIIQSWSYGGVCLQQTRSHEDNSRNTRCSSSEALHAQSLQKDNVFLRKSRNSHFLHGVESLTFTNDDLFALYSSFGDLLHALSLQTGKVFTSVRGCNFVLFKKQKQVGYLFRRGAEEKAIYLKHLFSPFKFFFRRLQVGKSVAAMFISSYTVTSVSSESVLSLWDFQNDNAISAVHAFSFPKLRYVTRDLCFAHFLEAMPSLSFSATTQTSLQDDVQKQGSVTNKCVFSPDGEVIALLEQNEITVHCVTKFNRTRVHHSVFKSEFDIMDAHLNFSADNSLLFICIQDDFMGPYFYVWDVEKKSMSGSFKSPGPLTVDCFCLSPDLNNLILCGGGYEIEIWEFKKHPRFLLKKMEVEGFYSPVKFSQCSVSSNNELLVCCISNLIYVFNFLVAHTLIYSSRRILRGHVSKIENCRFLKVNRYLISYDIDGMVFLWNITESKAIGFARIVQGQEKIASMAVSPEEDRVVCFLSSNRVCVIDLYKLESAMCTKVSTVLTKNKEKATESRIHLAERIPLTSNIPTSSADEFKPEASSSSDSEESYITDNDFYEFPESD